MRMTLFVALIVVAVATTAQEIAVAPPRVLMQHGARVDGATASDGASCIDSWMSDRTRSALAAMRVRSQELPVAPPAGYYLDEVVAATRGGTTLVAMSVFSSGVSAIAVARVRTDGTAIDGVARVIGTGRGPAIATNGETFLVAWSTRATADVVVLSPELEVLSRASFPGGWPRVAANGARYFCAFEDHRTRSVRGVVIDGNAAGEAFDVAKEARLGGVTAAGDTWAVALFTNALELCGIGADGRAACRAVAEAPYQSYAGDVAAAGEAVVIAWFAERPNRPATVPPPTMYDFRLTRVTAAGATELSTDGTAPGADDDVILFRSPSEPIRVGRQGLVALIPVAFPVAQHELYALMKSGSGATAFWAERETYALRATHLTASGIDETLWDQVLGARIVPLASDGENVLLSDGRVIDAAGTVVRRVELPEHTQAAAWDGRRWLFVTSEGILHRGGETMRAAVPYRGGLACGTSACVLAWISGDGPYDVRAIRIDSRRPLSRARRLLIARDVGNNQLAGVAAAGDSLLVAWSTPRVIAGRIFDARGRLGETIAIAQPVRPNDPLFFDLRSGRDTFLLAQNAWPIVRVHRVARSGAVLSSADVHGHSPRGLVEVDDRVLVFYESDRRAFVQPVTLPHR